MNEEEVTILTPLLGEHMARMVCALQFLAATCAHMGRQINQYEAMLTMAPPEQPPETPASVPAPPSPSSGTDGAAVQGEVVSVGGES